MRDCVRCGVPVDGLVCGKCGYTEATAGPKQRRGEPCESPGCSRWGTFKAEDSNGPWFCFKHYIAIPMPDWFRKKHPEFAKTFRPMTEADLEREAIQGES